MIDRDGFIDRWTDSLKETSEKDPRVGEVEDTRKKAGRKPKKSAPRPAPKPEPEPSFSVDKKRIRTALAHTDAGICAALGVEPRFDADIDLDPTDLLDLMAEMMLPVAQKYEGQFDKSPEGLAFLAIVIYAGSIVKDLPMKESGEEPPEESEGPIEPEKRTEF